MSGSFLFVCFGTLVRTVLRGLVGRRATCHVNLRFGRLEKGEAGWGKGSVGTRRKHILGGGGDRLGGPVGAIAQQRDRAPKCASNVDSFKRSSDDCVWAASLAVCDDAVSPHLGERQHRASALKPGPLEAADRHICPPPRA